MPSRFACFTPYHLLLAESIVHMAGIRDAEVIWCDESRLGDDLRPILESGPWRVALALQPIGTTHGLRRAAVYTSNRTAIARWAHGVERGDLFVFNPLRPETRVLVQRSSTRLHFVEDGLEAYVHTRSANRRQLVERRLASGLVGVPALAHDDFVAYAAWASAWALAPELVVMPPGVRPPPFRAIDPAVLWTTIERWTSCARPFGDPEAYELLAVLDHPSSARGLTAHGVAEHVATLAGVGPRVALKPHPRDPRTARDIAAGHDFVVLDPRWPLEVLLPSLATGASVLSGGSSGLLTSSLLRPDLRVTLHPSAAWLAEVLQAFRHLPRTAILACAP